MGETGGGFSGGREVEECGFGGVRGKRWGTEWKCECGESVCGHFFVFFGSELERKLKKREERRKKERRIG